jgi:hypothetical protein
MTISKISIPTLSLRKDIWTHFPVCLVKIPTLDSRDRWAVQWHQKHLAEWSQDIPGYETITKLRLLKALMASPKWKVERASAPSDLCVIAMNFTDPKDIPQPNLFAAEKPIQTIHDVKDYFPVCWKRHGNKYAFEFHNLAVKNMAREKNMDESYIREKTIQDILPILSTLGTVSNGSGICELTMAE